MKHRTFIRLATTALAALTVGTFAIAGQEPNHQPFNDGGRKTFTIDVALDAGTLVINHVDPSKPPTDQNRGDTLVIDGTVYPGYTLPSGINATNDPNAPGGIGKIRCRALVLVPLADITTPGASFVTEMYSLPNDDRMMLVDGLGANLFKTVRRAILGGTRDFEGATGEAVETNLGTNASGACNLRIQFKLRRSEHR
jgi:hypothetical protein